MAKALKRRKRNNGYTISLYAVGPGYLVTLSCPDLDHFEGHSRDSLDSANDVASDLWDTARDDFETEPWPRVTEGK